MARSTSFLIALLMTLVLCCSASASVPHTLGTGASLAVEDHAGAFLMSPDATFSCGFRLAGENAFTFSIWYTHAAEKTAVWTASPGNLVNGRASKITFRRDGDLALVDANGTTVWDTKTKGKELSLSLLESGNLVITDPSSPGRAAWQSFDSPTDTLVPTQPLTKDTRLVAGGFILYYDHTNNLLRLLYDGPVMSSNYWPNPDNNAFKNGRITYNSSRLGVLDDSGVFMSSDNLTVQASDLGQPGVKRRLTVGPDGNVRIYSLNNSSGGWTVTWAATAQPCSAHGLCGENALCEYVPRLRCSCPAGFEMVDRRDWEKGCRPVFTAPNCSKGGAQQFKFVRMPHTDFYGFDLGYIQSVTFEQCAKTCSDNCLCAAFSYRVDGRGLCFPKFRLFNGFRSSSFFGNIYLKVPIDLNISAPAVIERSSVGLEACDSKAPRIVLAGSPDTLFATPRNDMKWSYFFVFVGILGLLDLLFIVTGWWFLSSKHSIPSSLEAGYRMMVAAGQFRRFTYRELKDATGNFKEELGRGGSGVVYRGVLDEGKKVVAVKKLTQNVAQGDEEFWAEMTVIGRINHINLVRIWGFCSEGKRSKLLVYEFVENESLDKHLFVGTEHRPPLPWRERYRIALGTARGLAYLHHECLEWVIHCDVKPENILVTREFDAKIADFGLAKLSGRRDGGAGGVQFSHMRGTTGYMAPEWALNLPINAKVDVYSYGVVLLETVIGRRVADQKTPEGQPLEMPRIVQALRRVVDSGDVAAVVDGRLQGQFNPRQALEMVRISLACLEERSSSRPTMDDVAKALTAYDDEDEHPAYKS
ncbi:hypothetical protein QOZ80_1AG0028050 [Eleusine coracana subsp. coracana]|nr:hypothetical protein QOZ80_1AG0028050 [Eleusine coracana subsp. coracana]